jgi:Domain of unknown function (DUF4145)
MITCGACGRPVNADVMAGWPQNTAPADARAAASRATLWLQCPSCSEGSVKTRAGAVYPAAPAVRPLAHLPKSVERAWREAGLAHGAAAYTAAEMMCRKILMHMAVDNAGAQEGASFVTYVDALETAGYITTGLKSVVDQVRTRGNVANHDLPASSEQDSLTTLTITQHLLEAMYELPGMATPASQPPPATPAAVPGTSQSTVT